MLLTPLVSIFARADVCSIAAKSQLTHDEMAEVHKKLVASDFAGYKSEKDFYAQSRLFFGEIAKLGGGNPQDAKITRDQYDQFVKNVEGQMKRSSGGKFQGFNKELIEATGMMFSLLDLDGNKELTYHEFALGLLSIAAISKCDPQDPKYLDKLFSALDVDGSGFLEKAELVQWLQIVERLGGMSPEVVAHAPVSLYR